MGISGAAYTWHLLNNGCRPDATSITQQGRHAAAMRPVATNTVAKVCLAVSSTVLNLS